MEEMLSLAFMIFGLAFFMFVTRILTRDHREAWEQRMAETREFGFPIQNLDSEPTTTPRHRKK